MTIARNIVRDHVGSSRFRLEVTTADMRDADRVTDGPEDAVVQALTDEQPLACIRQPGGEQQECIPLRFLQGLSVAETPAVMGKEDGAVKALQHRAVRPGVRGRGPEQRPLPRRGRRRDGPCAREPAGGVAAAGARPPGAAAGARGPRGARRPAAGHPAADLHPAAGVPTPRGPSGAGTPGRSSARRH
ncbi:RNA polymerase sigma factor [Geodermatophilus sp. SYSU D00779]